jgi:hypothetical protein
MKRAWQLMGLGALALASSACEDGLEFCTNRDDAGQCPEIPVWDGGFDLDATPPSSDGATPDATTNADATTTTMDATTGDASADAAVVPDATAPATYNIEEFCAAQYGAAKAWQAKFEECFCSDSKTAYERSLFLLNALSYDDGFESFEKESLSLCVTRLRNAIEAANSKVTYVPSAAVACASKFASQFTSPPSACDPKGFALEKLEAEIGHQAQATSQLAECRAAFVGKAAFNEACSSAIDCAGNRRCRNGTCQEPLVVGNTCESSGECADGLVCQGRKSASRSCQPASMPVEVNANCEVSAECRTGNFCGPDLKCIAPSNALICAQAAP